MQIIKEELEEAYGGRDMMQKLRDMEYDEGPRSINRAFWLQS